MDCIRLGFQKFRCLILTDSLSSIKAMLSRRISGRTHPLVYECKQLCFDLMRDLIEVKLVWIPSHVGLVGNELVDGEARYGSLNGSILERPPPPCDFQSLARPVLLREWQGRWDLADHGRFAHSILPRVSLRPWFEGQKEERSIVTSVSRIMSGHSSVRSHWDRFGIFEGPMCVCRQDDETVDHLIWHCERFGPERHRLIDALSELNVLHGTPVWDVCGLRK
jgi:hypothetical protein